MKKTIVLVAALFALVVSVWYAVSGYQKNSGGSLQKQILQEREDLAKKNAKPKPSFKDLLAKINLTPEQQAKVDAANKLGEGKKGDGRMKAVWNILTDEQRAQLKKGSGEEESQWDKTLKTLRTMDQQAIEKRAKEWEKKGKGAAARKGGKKEAGKAGDSKSAK